MSEMIATANAKSIEDIKSFISRAKETYKVPYETHPADRLRQFTYASAGQKWDTDKMVWEDNGVDSWSSSTITVKNKSSKGITVTFKYESETDNKGVTGYTVTPTGSPRFAQSVTNDFSPKFTVEKATAGENGANGTETVAEFPITPTGIYTGTNEEAVKVGTITITLS